MRSVVSLMSCALAGCGFFWYSPGSSEGGNTCVGTNAYLGQQIKNDDDGRVGTLTKLYGSSERCRRDTAHPFLADVDYGGK